MTRYTQRFEIDTTRDPDILDMIDDLKSGNQYAPAVRNGIRIMHNLVIDDDLSFIISDRFLNQYQNRSAVEDLRKALNLILAIEQLDIETIFVLYPHLIQPMIQYSIQFTGLNGMGRPLISYDSSFQASPQDESNPKEIPFDKDKAAANLLA